MNAGSMSGVSPINEIEGFLTPEECARFRDLVLHTPEDSTCFTDTGVFTNRKWTDAILAQWFFDRLAQHCIADPNLIRPNNLIMCGLYAPGNVFGMHTDTGLYYNRATCERSRWTLLIYLNDDYVGGTTSFFDDKWKLTRTVVPKPGKAILFDIDLWHRGEIVTEGHKLWIGCEIIGFM